MNADLYKVVFNDAHQYSIWPAGTAAPSGWHDEGKIGNKQECLIHIRSVWKEMRPVTGQSGNDDPEFHYESLLHELIETQVAQIPDAPAVIFDDRQLTYGELNQYSNQVAIYLNHLGVHPEVPVCIVMDHSLELVIAIVGILKAGGVCVPLDPAYPTDHLNFILEDTATSIVLTQEEFVGKFSQKSIRALTLREAYNFTPGETIEWPDEPMTSDNLAFIFYTSGSTGKPKGVMLSHRAIHSHNVWRSAVYSLKREDRHLFRCPVGFAFLLTEIMLPLLTGGTIVIALPEKREDTTYLMKLIAKNKIVIVNFVPSQIRMFLEEPNLDECASVMNWVTGGEGLPVWLQRKFYARFNASLSIIYGSTEARSSTLWICPRQQEVDAVVPIGRAAPGKKIFVLDSNLQPVGPGETGELYIAGEGLARGYLRRPDLTAEKFVPNPFSDKPGDRFYKTGDLARYQSDQTLEFLGRMDQQVKVQGFRIELGQIEAALGEHPAVQEVIVTCREDRFAKNQIVAHVVSGQTSASAATFMDWLEQKIPAYMLPTTIQLLPAIPRTSHGKVDFHQLEGLKIKRNDFVTARNPIEQSLMTIWQQVFGSDEIGVEDDFFELGGDSLLAARIISRIRETFDVQLEFKLLFEHATVAQLGQILKPQMNAEEHR